MQIRSGKPVPWYEDIKRDMQWIFIGMQSDTENLDQSIDDK